MIRLTLSIIIYLLSTSLVCQTRWSKVFYDNEDAIGNVVINSYDKGVLLSGKHGSNTVEYNWLIKTDVNGDIIWEKTIGAPGTNIKISAMAENRQGELFLAGLTGFYNEEDYDPLIMKLNTCGEKEWCAVFVEEQNNFSNAVLSTEDGGCVAVLRYMNTDFKKDRICLVNLDSFGTLVWKHCYNSADTSLGSEDAKDLTLCPDGGYLITGRCYYKDPNPPHSGYAKPYFIKTDSVGIFEWESVVHSESSENGGYAWNTVVNPSSTYFYSAISHYYNDSPVGDSPALLKIDLNGNVVNIYDLAPPNEYGKMTSLKFLTDSTIASSAVWGSQGGPKAVIIDTTGNILYQNPVLDNEWMGHVEITHDQKILYMTNLHNDNDEFDTYLYKLNQNLQSDSIYTQPFVYDSLCDGEIVSDTIVQDDCGLIVGMEEIYTPKIKTENKVIIYPNPARDKFIVQSSMFSEGMPSAEVGGCSIEVFDLFGRRVKEIQVPKEQTEVEVITTGWKKGMYVVRVIGRDGIVGSGKVVVE